MDELREWLNDECSNHGLSWREASLRAGVNPGAISAIMSGARPGLKVCVALADFFGTSPEHVLRLAGHLPDVPDKGEDAEFWALWHTFQQLPEEDRKLVLDYAAWRMQQNG